MSEQQQESKPEKDGVCFCCGLVNRKQPDLPEYRDKERFFQCPECKNYVELRTRKFGRHILLRACCLCKRQFVLNENDSIGRDCCHSRFCVEKYRYYCGIGNRFWRKKQDAKPKT